MQPRSHCLQLVPIFNFFFFVGKKYTKKTVKIWVEKIYTSQKNRKEEKYRLINYTKTIKYTILFLEIKLTPFLQNILFSFQNKNECFENTETKHRYFLRELFFTSKNNENKMRIFCFVLPIVLERSKSSRKYDRSKNCSKNRIILNLFSGIRRKWNLHFFF